MPLTSLPNQTRSHRVQSWILVLLAFVAAVVIVLAYLGFQKEMKNGSDNQSPIASSEKNMSESSHPLPVNILSGIVSEVVTRGDTSEKWITVSVALPETTDDQFPKTKKPTMKNVPMTMSEYKFLLSKDTEGADQISGGEQVEVAFIGDPSTDTYMHAEKIDQLDPSAPKEPGSDTSLLP